MHNKLKKIVKEQPDSEEISELRKALRSYNQSKAGTQEYKSILISRRNEENKLIGGLYGEIAWQWLHIDLLWVDEEYRGKGIGSELIKDSENYANKHGIYSYRLSTSDFQAPAFYEKLGYTEYGRLRDLPPGYTTYFYFKTEH